MNVKYLHRTLSKLLDVSWTTFPITTTGKNICVNSLHHINEFQFAVLKSIQNTVQQLHGRSKTRFTGHCDSNGPPHSYPQHQQMQTNFPNSVTTTLSSKSHTHTVVWECCKNNDQSQWRMANFDPRPPLNPLINLTKICIGDYVGYIYHPAKFYSDQIRGFASTHAWLCTPPFTRLSFLGSRNHLQSRCHHGHPRKICQKMQFCARTCLLGVAKLKFNIYTPFSP